MNNLIRFIVKYQFILLFIVLEVVSFWILATHSYYQQSKIEKFTRIIDGAISRRIDKGRQYFRLAETNRFLAKENIILRDELARISSKNEILSRLTRDTVTDPIFNYIPAKVINNSINKQHNYITLDVGLKHGVSWDCDWCVE
jgi:rod shape-determining protein MreC